MGGAGKRHRQRRGEEIVVEGGAGKSIRWTPAKAYSAARISSNFVQNNLSGLPDKLSGFPDTLLRVLG